MFRPALALASLLALHAVPAVAESVTVFAAASLKSALDLIAPEAEAATGHDLTLVYAGTSALARQIEAGAPADIFISANADWMDRIEAAGGLVVGSRVDLLENRLVLIGHGPANPIDVTGPEVLRAGLGAEWIAVALVEAVPAGIYAKAALQSLGIWEDLQGQIVQTDNVRAALALVSLGETPFGVTYATDAVADPTVTVLGVFAEGSHPPIRYPAALLTDGAAQSVLDYLTGPDAAAIFVAQGFTLPGG